MQSLLSHPSLMDCRRLFLRDYEVFINIGVHDFEKTGEQRVLINVDLYIPLAVSTPRADELDEVVDYDFMRRSISQRVVINVDLYVPLAVSTPKADELHEVLDYDFIRRTIAERVSKGHIHLQETLCDDVLALMMEHPKVRAARVSTEKPDVYPDCASVGCEVFGLKDKP